MDATPYSTVLLVGLYGQRNSLQVSEKRSCLRRVEHVIERRHPTVAVVDTDDHLSATGDIRSACQEGSLSPVNVQFEIPVILRT